jgi:ABC-2 type transport system ATP-binding protein
VTEPAITVDGLVKRYRGSDTNAVDGISFTVEAGSFFTLLGPNGAGKTTTISILTTTLAPTDGVACVAGFDVRRESSEVRQRVGIIFQNHSLDQNLTAEENVRLHAVLYGMTPWRPLYRLMSEDYRARVAELAGLLGIGDDMFKPVRTFSGGMKRKLEIVRSLMHHPQVLFLDEPSAGLDPASRRALWAYLKDVREKGGTTVFLTTHYLEEAEDSDRVCIIAKGKVVALGSPAEVKSTVAAAHTPTLEDAYLAIVERS